MTKERAVWEHFQFSIFRSTLDEVYIRDKRSPTPKNETVSRVMSRNRAKDSKPEMALRRAYSGTTNSAAT
jgi:hypothetical protein